MLASHRPRWGGVRQVADPFWKHSDGLQDAHVFDKEPSCRPLRRRPAHPPTLFSWEPSPHIVAPSYLGSERASQSLSHANQRQPERPLLGAKASKSQPEPTGTGEPADAVHGQSSACQGMSAMRNKPEPAIVSQPGRMWAEPCIARACQHRPGQGKASESQSELARAQSQPESTRVRQNPLEVGEREQDDGNSASCAEVPKSRQQ